MLNGQHSILTSDVKTFLLKKGTSGFIQCHQTKIC
uniref:Uncharacterized protein n=1 Tax=Rhizophora mucronata TaxID=61149 RepID=A0A2P2QU34_RHIMU